MNFSKSLLILCFSLFAYSQANAQLNLDSEYGNLTECDTLSKGVFVMWWDNDVDQSVAADLLLDEMLRLRQVLLSDYNMEDPPNPAGGSFINVYIHRPDVSTDFFINEGWANGVGGENNGAHWTVPAGLLEDFANAAHETCHIFQFSSNSIGYDELSSDYFFEASAEWFGLAEYPNSTTAHITSKTLTRMPHVPLWLSWSYYPDSYPVNWQRENHQYALGTFFYYLTEEAGMEQSSILEGFYNSLNITAQEYLYNKAGGDNFRQFFVDFAARCTNDFDFLSDEANERAEEEWEISADPNDNNEFVLTLSDAGTNNWFRAADDVTTNAWAFNTIKLNNTENETYSFEIKGDGTGSEGTASNFRGKVVVKNAVLGTSFHDLNMTNLQEGSVNLTFTPDDTEIYLIIASVPTYFEDMNDEFQTFPYEAKITKGATTSTDNINAENNDIDIFPSPADDFLMLRGDLSNYTLDLISTTGKVLQRIDESGTSARVNISNLLSGVYFLRMVNKVSNQVYIEKVIKQI